MSALDILLPIFAGFSAGFIIASLFNFWESP